MNPVQEDKTWRRLTLTVLVVAAALRVVLCVRGGQFFFPDESRYAVSRDVVAYAAAGNWRAAAAAPFAGGDHVGFKVLGVVPAAIERLTGPAPLVPALYFSGFSVAGLALVGGIARRLGGSARARAMAVAMAAGSATLFYYTRHLLPYDASMALALGALFVGLERGEKVRLHIALLAGVLAGAAALVYYGYWTLAAMATLVGAVYRVPAWRERALRLGLAVAGGCLMVGFAVALDRLAGEGRFIEQARVFSRTITQGDTSAVATTWSFLWKAERLWLAVAVVAAGGSVAGWRRTRNPALAGGVLAGACALAFWVSFVVTADGMHRFTVYGRLIRQLAPFLSVAAGFGLAEWSAGRTRRYAALGALLAGNAAVTFATPLLQQFPGDFFSRWSGVAAARQEAETDAGAYFRFVNVAHYVQGPEILPEVPLETIAASAHPFEFEPYLYEGATPEIRAIRRAADHRMRLVRVGVPATARVERGGDGSVTFEVQFAAGSAGRAVPLVSVGGFQRGEVFFARFLTNTSVRFECEIVPGKHLVGEPVEIVPGRTYRIRCFSGGMLPRALGGFPEAKQKALRNFVSVVVDDREVLGRLEIHDSAPMQTVYLGANVSNASLAEARFNGTIRAVGRGALPEVPEQVTKAGEFGGVAVRFIVAGPTGRPEPLAVVGEPGAAVLCYVIPLAGDMAKLGLEVWGVGTFETGPIPLQPGENRVEFQFGGLYPPLRDGGWQDASMATQTDRKSHVRIVLNYRRVYEKVQPTPEFSGGVVSIGQNPIGGSYVLPAFTGSILGTERSRWP